MQISTNVELSPIYATLMENVSILQARVPDSTHEATESHYILVRGCLIA